MTNSIMAEMNSMENNLAEQNDVIIYRSKDGENKRRSDGARRQLMAESAAEGYPFEYL